LNRQDLQQLADIRQNEVEVLLDNHQYSGAYYLSGYIVEYALKACIAKQTKEYDFPDKKTVLNSYNHNLVKLVKVANLETDLRQYRGNPSFEARWLTVRRWTEESRYERHDRQTALDIYESITNPNYGVLQWLQQHW
jgi:hypothetical protein